MYTILGTARPAWLSKKYPARALCMNG
ncbi:hypothetical protein [Paenibacillus allorhizoplanae]|nr:hypothetical protein [Paenibacillus allorhizoplanae]